MSTSLHRAQVEDVYPLSPMQQGMVFHTLAEPGSGVYVEQIRLALQGLDADCFRRAWEVAFARFAALRTSIVGSGRRQPAQVVRRSVELLIKSVPAGNPQIAVAQVELALCLSDLGRLDEAGSLLDTAEPVLASHYGADSSQAKRARDGRASIAGKRRGSRQE